MGRTMDFDSIEDSEASFGPNIETIMSDVPNFTNVSLVIRLSNNLSEVSVSTRQMALACRY